MAALTVASVSVVAAPSCRLAEKIDFSRGSLSLSAPCKSSKLVANRSRVVMSADKKQNLALPTVVALMAAVVVPEIAEAASPGISPSLKNLLLSVAAGGVVLSAIGVAVAGVSVFDPVKRK